MIVIDKKIVCQIISNLLSNAIKYSFEESEVGLVTDIHEDKLTFIVTDHGIGIAREDLPSIFDPFYRTQNAIHLEGTGLGLNIVKRMIDVLNGTIHVESEIDKGTSFKVAIPLNNSFEELA